MKFFKLIAPVSALAFTFTVAPVSVMADEDPDVTMTVLEEGAEPESVYSIIELPRPTKNDRVQQRDGNSTAREARERGADMRNQALEAAREAVGNDVARGVLDNLPNDVRNNIPQPPPAHGNPGAPDIPQIPPSQNRP